MIELECPECTSVHWEIDCDHRQLNSDFISYTARPYLCPCCKRNGPGYSVLQASPPEFFIQPSHLHPMKRQDIAYWRKIQETFFPRRSKEYPEQFLKLLKEVREHVHSDVEAAVERVFARAGLKYRFGK